MSLKHRSKIGKGLEALLGAAHLLEPSVKEKAVGESNDSQNVLEIKVEQLFPGRFQPRGEIKEADIISLADSIRAQGVLQPIMAMESSGNRYEIIAGERRWRASQLAGLATVPVLVKKISEEKAMAIALIENIQREDLHPLEEARALQRLITEFNLTHSQIAEAIGKSRASVTNSLRLLALSDSVKELLEQKELEVGHAKVLMSLKGDQQSEAARSVVEKGLSVRDTEALVSKMIDVITPEHFYQSHAAKPLKNKHSDPDVQSLLHSLADKLGATVNIIQGKNGKGKIVIHYSSLDELDGILAHIQ